MRVFFGIALLLTALAPGAKGQATGHGKELVMYDPLFWKDELKMKDGQSRRIQEINREFYDGLRLLKQVPHSKSEMQSQLDFSLQERSVKIWATLGNRQKKKLEKILEATALQGP